MAAFDSSTGYWFDVSSLTTAPRKTPLEAIGSVLPGRQLSDAQQEALVAFAAANDLHYLSWIRRNERVEPLPSLVLDDVCLSLVTGPKPHLLEFGNHGWRFWKHESDGGSSRRGYIAIRHGLGLPHVYLDSRTPGAATVLGAASVAIEVAGALDFDGGTADRSAVDEFTARATRIELPAGFGFAAYADDRQAGAAAALLGGPAAPLLIELASSFDIEITQDWIFAYSNFGEVSTLDPEIWAWAFRAASRLFDALGRWGADTDGILDRAWYTAESVERPGGRDGALRSLAPARRSRLGRFLFGDPDA